MCVYAHHYTFKDHLVCVCMCLCVCPYTWSTYGDELLLAGVNDAHFLVLASSADEAAVAAPAHAENDIGMHVVQRNQRLARPNIPDHDHIVAA